MMDSGHLVDVRQQAVYKALRRLRILIATSKFPTRSTGTGQNAIETPLIIC